MKKFIITQFCVCLDDTFVEKFLVQAKNEKDAFDVWHKWLDEDVDDMFTEYNDKSFTTTCENILEFRSAKELKDKEAEILSKYIVWIN